MTPFHDLPEGQTRHYECPEHGAVEWANRNKKNPRWLFHTTTKARQANILNKGLLPFSDPTWFASPAPYVMLSVQPWPALNGSKSKVLRVDAQYLKTVNYFNPEGVRYPNDISPHLISLVEEAPVRGPRCFKCLCEMEAI